MFLVGTQRKTVSCSHRIGRKRAFSSSRVEPVDSYLEAFYFSQSRLKCNHLVVNSETHGKPRKEKSRKDAFLLKKKKTYHGTCLTWELWSAVCTRVLNR